VVGVNKTKKKCWRISTVRGRKGGGPETCPRQSCNKEIEVGRGGGGSRGETHFTTKKKKKKKGWSFAERRNYLSYRLALVDDRYTNGSRESSDDR